MREVSLVKTWVGAVGMLIAAGSLTGALGLDIRRAADGSSGRAAWGCWW
jgi:hypothetical protein